MNGKIQGTTDYGMFKTQKGNRKITPGMVNRLVRSIKKHNMLRANPIIVNAKGYVIDGQHRLEAAKLLKETIYYVVVEPANLHDIQLLNANLRPWMISDFLNSYIELGKKEYVKFKEFHDKYGFPFTSTISLLSGKTEGGSLLRKFREGLFEIDDMAAATLMADRIMEIKDFLNVRTFTSSRFYRTVFKIMRNDLNLFDRIIEKIRGTGTQIYPCDNTLGYLRQFEDVLNKGKIGARIRLT